MAPPEQLDDGNARRGEATPLQALEDLLTAAMRIADAIGLSFPAIRIEEALLLVRAQSESADIVQVEEPISLLH